MIGILLVAHANLGREFINAVEFIMGRVEGLGSLSVEVNQDPNEIRTGLSKAVEELSGPEGVLILTDMFGGTPNNTSLALLEEGKVEVVTGMNLPMVIKAISARKDASLAELARQVCQEGKKAISVAGELLGS